MVEPNCMELDSATTWTSANLTTSNGNYHWMWYGGSKMLFATRSSTMHTVKLWNVIDREDRKPRKWISIVSQAFAFAYFNARMSRVQLLVNVMGTLLLEKKNSHSPNAWVEIKFRKKQILKKISCRKPAHRKDVRVWPVLPKLIPNWKLCWFFRSKYSFSV